MTATKGDASRLRAVGDVLLTAIACALFSGVVHGGVSWFRRAVLHDLLRTWMSPDTVWMSPLGYLLVFAPVAVVIAVGAALLPRAPWRRVAIFVFGTAAAFSILLLFPRLHQYASLALSLGVGVRLSTAAMVEGASWRPALARASMVLGAVAVASWGYQVGSVALRERRALASLGPARDGAPNVLLLILDTVRASSLSMYGAERRTTPRLDAWAQSGAIFDWAFSTAPWTLPSHASMFTGRYSSQQTGNWTTPLDGAHATLAGVFASYGYATGGFTANLVATPRGFGLDRGFSRYEDHRRSLSQAALTTSLGQAGSLRNAWHALAEQRWVGGALRALARMDFEPRYSYPDNDPKTAADINEAFLRWQAGTAGRPFLAFLNYFDAHGPYESPARYDTLFGASDRVRDKYDRSIRYLDDALAALFDSLASRRLLDNTIVVVTADHGEQFGEHGLSWHSNSLYEQLTHVPLIVRFPSRVPAGVRVPRQVSLRDLAATLVDLAGFPDAKGLAGTSLAVAWQSPGTPTSAAISELSRGVNPDASALNARGDMRAVADDSLHYIRNGDGRVELYAYRRDPREERDLGTSHGALVPGLEQLLNRSLAGATTPASASRPPRAGGHTP